VQLAWIDIRLRLSPEDEEGALRLKVKHRASLVKQYADSVAAKIVEFNENLAEKMTTELNRRKSAIVKAEKELEDAGLPRVYNPKHAETAVQIERVLQGLGARVTSASSCD
jgi:hypothetical protein